MTTKTHTLGLIFTKDFSHVLLMHKNRPDWQKGKMNAVGGKIEEGEASINGMIREVWEETGCKTKIEDWVLFGELTSSEWNIDMYTLHHQGKLEDFQTNTDEAIEWVPITALPNNIISNLRWMVPMAVEKLIHNGFGYSIVKYD